MSTTTAVPGKVALLCGILLLGACANQSPARPDLLAFALEDGEWRLIHDQNTRVPAPDPAD